MALLFRLTLLLIAAYSLYTHPLQALFPTLYTPHPESPEWSMLINCTTNAFFSWRWDPLFQLFGNELPGQESIFFFLISFFLLFLGAALLFRSLIQTNWALPILDSALFSISLLALFGADSVIFGSLCWVPLAILACRPHALLPVGASYREVIPRWTLALFFIFRIARSSHQLSLLIIPLVLFLSHRLYSESIKHKGGYPYRIFIAFALSISLYASWNTPLPVSPVYPDFVAVVPDDGVPGNVSPLVSSYENIQLIDRKTLRSSLRDSSLFLGLLALCLFVFSGKRRKMFSLAVFGFICIAIDCMLPESLSIIGPIQTLRRLMPGAFFLSLTPVCLALSLLVFWASAIRSSTIVTPLIFLLTWTPLPASLQTRALSPQFAKFIDSNALSAKHDILKSSNKSLLKYVASPSYRIYQREGLKRLLTIRSSPKRIVPLNKLGSPFSASHNSDPTLLRKLSDGHAKTRWSEMTGKQKGNEWIMLEFNQALRLYALELNVGNFATDFPRGIRVLGYTSDCSSLSEQSSSYQLYENSDWQGSLGFTLFGYPYYQPQHKVNIPIISTTRFRCIKVEQIGRANFDWSVTNIRLGVSVNQKLGD